MVLLQTAGHIGECHNAGSCQEAGLAQTTAQHLAVLAGAVDELLAARYNRAHRGAQTLGQAEHYTVTVLGDLLHIAAQGSGGIEQPGTIQMHRQAMPGGPAHSSGA